MSFTFLLKLLWKICTARFPVALDRSLITLEVAELARLFRKSVRAHGLRCRCSFQINFGDRNGNVC